MIRSGRYICAISLGLLVALTQVAVAETTETFIAAEDSYINGLRAGANFGSSGDVVVHKHGPKIGLVQFDLSIISGANVSNASFRFRLNKLRTAGNIDLQLITEAWSESTVNYGNQPAFGGTLLSVPVTTADIGSVVSVDVTSIVQGWANGSQLNHGLRLATSSGIKAEIDSLESSGTPMQLVVTTDSGPPNIPPQLDAIGPQAVTVGETLQFQVSADDLDGTMPSIVAANLPGNATMASFVPSGATGTFTWTPEAGDVGTYTTVTFTAVDQENPAITDSEVITITVNSLGGGTTQTLSAVEDSYINGIKAGINYGSNGDVVVHKYGPKIGLVQFDLSTLSGANVSNASFRFRLNNLRTAGNIDLQLITEAWSESTVNYGNQPAFGGTLLSVPVTTADIGSVVSVDVTSIVQGWANGSQLNHGLRLATSSGIKAEIDSLESSGTPMQLVVAIDTGPPNIPPLLDAIGPQSVDELGSLIIPLSASDEDPNGLIFSAVDLPEFAELTNNGNGTGSIAVSPGPNDFGETSVTIIVTDNRVPALTDEETILLTVVDVNQAPTDIQLSNSSVFEGAANDSVVGALSTIDPDSSDSHTYILDDDAGGRFSLAGNEVRVLDGSLFDVNGATSHDISVTTTDSGNLTLSKPLTISVDANDAPEIVISSHAQNDDVPASGFILSGTVTDDIGIGSITATLNDPLLGLTVDQKPLDVAGASGKWSLVVFEGQTSLGETVSITLAAVDSVGKSDTLTIDLNVIAADRSGRHLINRITFGATPSLLQEVETIGAAGYIAQQMDPASIDDSNFDSLIAGFNPVTVSDLKRYQILHAAHSKRQLREVLTLFWDNHFNTSIHAHGNVQYELDENDDFRANALGNFRDLLEISAKGPSMLFYLNGVSNIAADPNENYARELMELHTLKVDGGYTQFDVDEVARALTGWTVLNDAYFFDAAQHDTESKLVLGNTIPAGGGIDDGEQVLDILASHPSTANFICEKLIVLFVADNPPASLSSQCATTFQSSSAATDQIAQVVGLILASVEFNDPAFYLDKVKTPFEYAVGTVRQLEAQGDLEDLSAAVESMGMPLFENHIPTGYSETGDDWISSNLALERMKFVNEVARSSIGGADANIDPLAFFPLQGYETAEGIVGYLFELVLGDSVTQVEWDTALGVLTDDGATTFDIEATDAELKLRRLIGTVLSFPGFNYQ